MGMKIAVAGVLLAAVLAANGVGETCMSTPAITLSRNWARSSRLSSAVG